MWVRWKNSWSWLWSFLVGWIIDFVITDPVSCLIEYLLLQYVPKVGKIVQFIRNTKEIPNEK